MKVNTQDMRHKILRAVYREPRCADDDKLLIAKIWEFEGWDYSLGLYQNLRNVSSPETIRRTRQKLVEEHKIVPMESTTKARYKEINQVRMSI